jgi:hypothetical protein
MRRKHLGTKRSGGRFDANNLLAFLYDLAACTKSLLLATATPVQLYPVEVWDLLNVLALGNEHVLGNTWSNWRHAEPALELVMGHQSLPQDDMEVWGWLRNTLPPSAEDRDFEVLRRSLHLPDAVAVAPAVTGANCESLTKRVCADWHGISRCSTIRVSGTSCGVRVNTWKPPRPRNW